MEAKEKDEKWGHPCANILKRRKRLEGGEEEIRPMETYITSFFR